ncbi:MAG: DUF421 domain-containing protein [Oscillospiraceae bacterium]|jgi:uncharacterized membrane protein YcaP (DUF421 family)|nr:DUF421 domain-containing protein [Oscillospiraceae bacterium]
MELMRSVGHTVILYFIVVVAFRLLGKRQIGDMQPSELVVTILASEMASIPMQDPDQPLINGIVPIALLLLFELLLSFGFMKSRFLWRVFEGRETILVEKGKLNERAMRRNRITLAELFEMLRLQGYTDLSQLRYAIFETNGQMSVIPYEAHKPLTPAVASAQVQEPGMPQILISDGRVMKKKLKKLGLNEQWLKNELAARGAASVRDAFIFTRDECGNIYFIPKEKHMRRGGVSA